MAGRDKGLVPFRGRPLIAWVIAAMAPQVAGLVINANRNLDLYRAFGHPVIPDDLEQFQGPLAGIMSAMASVRTPWVVTVPCDGPFVAPDLVARLGEALIREGAELAVASDGQRLQPVYALIPIRLARSLDAFLASGDRKVERWLARHRLAVADFDDRPGCFANVNTESDAVSLRAESPP